MNKNCSNCKKPIIIEKNISIKTRNRKTKYYCVSCYNEMLSYWGKNYGKEKSKIS